MANRTEEETVQAIAPKRADCECTHRLRAPAESGLDLSIGLPDSWCPGQQETGLHPLGACAPVMADLVLILHGVCAEGLLLARPVTEIPRALRSDRSLRLEFPYEFSMRPCIIESIERFEAPADHVGGANVRRVLLEHLAVEVKCVSAGIIGLHQSKIPAGSHQP